MQKKILMILAAGLAVLGGCAATEWAVIDDVKHEGKQIAALRKEVEKPNLDLSSVLIIRTRTEDGARVEVTSISPTVVSAQKDGPPAARTTLALTQGRDKLIMFSQDVPNWKAFRREIPVAELVPGKTFRFPVVQESGEIKTRTFTVEAVITQ